MSDLKLFFRYITPSMLGMLIAGVYSIVDIFFVGIAVGEEGLAAISLAFPVVMLVYGIGDMIGTGAGILISRERGCGNAAEANRFFNRMLLMELLAGVLLPLLVIPWLGLILTGSGATPELLPGAYSYTAILLGAGVMQMVAMGLMTAIRNDGRPILAMWLVVVGLVGNIGLDALFMIGLGWGLVGAAVATVLAQGMAMLCSLGYFFTRYAGWACASGRCGFRGSAAGFFRSAFRRSATSFRSARCCSSTTGRVSPTAASWRSPPTRSSARSNRSVRCS